MKPTAAGWFWFAYMLLIAFSAGWTAIVWADPALLETRCCVTEIARDADGAISRRSDVVAAFKRRWPCPSTGMSRGACPKWAVDHVVPLVCGGFDSVGNVQWLPVKIKSCAGSVCKDRIERRVYCR